MIPFSAAITLFLFRSGHTRTVRDFEQAIKFWKEVYDAHGRKLYELGERDGAKFIRCYGCKRDSFNPGDIHHRYCGACHVFFKAVELTLVNAERS